MRWCRLKVWAMANQANMKVWTKMTFLKKKLLECFDCESCTEAELEVSKRIVSETKEVSLFEYAILPFESFK